MTVLDRAEVILEADDSRLLAGTRRGGVAMVALGNIAADVSVGLLRRFGEMGKASVRAAIDMEKLKRGLEVTAGGAQAANRQMAELEKIARLPGLGFREVIAGATQLNVAFSDTDDQLSRTTRTLSAFGRAVALTGGGPAELGRVIDQVTQMAAAGRILQEDLRPIIRTAPAVGQALEDAFGTINPQELEALGLTTNEFFDQLIGSLNDLPAPVETADNALENLEDAAFRASAAMGEMFLPLVTAGASLAASQLERMADAVEEVRERSTGLNRDAILYGETGHMPRLIESGEPGSRAGGAESYLPRRDPDVDLSGRDHLGANDPGALGRASDRARARIAAFREEVAALRESNEATREAGLQTLALNAELAVLHSLIRDIPEPLVDLTDGLEESKIAAFDLEDATAGLSAKLGAEALNAKTAEVAIKSLTSAQLKLNEVQAKGSSALRGLGLLGTALGIGIPGLGAASGLFGAFNAFSGLFGGGGGSGGLDGLSGGKFFAGEFAEGGTIEAGHWGIVGEAGPEIVTGPAHITPMSAGDASVTINLSGMPPSTNPLGAARDPDWIRFLMDSNFVIAANGG